MYSSASLQPHEQSVRLLIDVGDGLHLWFDDRRIGARLDDRDVAVRLTGADVPSDLLAVRVRGRLGEQLIDERHQPHPHQFFRTTWDGLGAEAGRAWVSDLEVGWELAAEFPRPARTRWWSRQVVCGSLDFRSFGFGGFSPDVVHRLDVAAAMLWRADGSQVAGALTERAAVLAGVRVGADEFAVPDGEQVHIFDEQGLFLGTLQGRKHRVVATADHDEQGRIRRFSKAGHEFVVEHRPDTDGSGEVLIESPAEVWVAVELDDDGRAVTLLDHERNRTSLVYDATGALARIEDSAGLVTEIERDELGRVTAMADSTGRHQTVQRIDPHEVLVTSAEGRTRRLRTVREPDGTITETEIDEAGLTTIARTDGEERSVARPDGMVETVSRSVRSTRRAPITVTQHLSEAPSGRVLARTRESGRDEERVTIGERVWTRRFDGTHNTLTSIGPDEIEATARLTPGSSLVVSEPGAGELEIRFDALRRPKRRRQDTEVRYGYDQYNRLAWSEIERLRHQIRHDERGRVIGIHSTRGWTRFERDPAGWIRAIVDSADNETRIERRADGRIEAIVYPVVDGHAPTERRRYDRDGHLVACSWHDDGASAIEVQYERDSAGRIGAITSDDGKVLVGWDPETGVLSEMHTSDGDSIQWSWDGDMCTAEISEGRAAARIERVHDEGRRVISRSVNGVAVTRAHGPDGWLSMVGPLVVDRNRSARQPTGYRLGGLKTSIERDRQGRIVSHQTRLGQLATVPFAEEIERDEVGRITRVREHANGIERLIDYRYDEAGRLIDNLVDGESLLALRWDEADNPTAILRQGRRVDYASDAVNRLTSVAGNEVTHDARGNVVAVGQEGAARRCTYDGLGQLRDIAGGTGRRASYWYDPLGRPIEVRASSDGINEGTTRLVWDGPHLAATLNAAGAIDLRFIATHEQTLPEALVRGNDSYLLLRDHLGSVRAVVHATTGAVVQTMAFDPLGRVLYDTNPGWQPFGFRGGLTDGVTGVVRFGRRVFDPLIGRFLDANPDGLTGDSLNRWLYAHGDPVNPVESRVMTHDASNGTPLSSAAGELTIAGDPYLLGRPVPPNRSWLATEAWRTAVGEPVNPDRVTEIRSDWSVERPAETPTFAAVWDPMDWCTGPGGFEYQPSATPSSNGRLGRVGERFRNPPTLRQIADRLQSDLARLIETDPG